MQCFVILDKSTIKYVSKQMVLIREALISDESFSSNRIFKQACFLQMLFILNNRILFSYHKKILFSKLVGKINLHDVFSSLDFFLNSYSMK